MMGKRGDKTSGEILDQSGFESYRDLTRWARNQLNPRDFSYWDFAGTWGSIQGAVTISEMRSLFKAHFGLNDEEAEGLLNTLSDIGLIEHVYSKHLAGGPLAWVLGDRKHRYRCTKFIVSDKD